jgi:hypothetical protein
MTCEVYQNARITCHNFVAAERGQTIGMLHKSLIELSHFSSGQRPDWYADILGTMFSPTGSNGRVSV